MQLSTECCNWQDLHQEMSNGLLQAAKNGQHHTDHLIDLFTFVIHRFSTDVTKRPIPKFHSTKPKNPDMSGYLGQIARRSVAFTWVHLIFGSSSFSW